MVSNKFITSSAEETQKIGEEFARELKKGDFVALFGELGGGKTTFIQGLSKGLGIKKIIISPTFLILRSYMLKKASFRNFYHIDLYRFDSVNKMLLQDLGIDEILQNKEGIVVVEWAEKMKNIFPDKRWEIRFTHADDNKREIIIKKINGK